MLWQPYHLKDGSAASHTIVSDAGYAILRCTAEGIPTGRYVAFRYRLQGSEVLGGYDSAEEAKTACEAHRSKCLEAAA